ncbi:PREDICTED: uncharacterized protein LOC105362183 [Ceratosolen solmsi marchali]|uniref:Uncharacterized protein LOC105362183 n=1 Tax=Ceratosolen solmsi marchali TaxID=326594 RepID=A0AAJ7DVE8_9HYME|nr:PREDICTED: uncharacterized protein LOC105362183 [Ceratosolen solmsi marchali]XP_011497857.1 PREDICTED: uncharacterized protein LOC105362183 [Ceratosolen solmsi marchali]
MIMQGIGLVMTALVLATLVIAENGFTVGRRIPGDDEIDIKTERARGPPDYALSYYKTYVGDNYRVITQVVIEEVANSGTYTAIIAGGPGHTYVTLAYVVPRYVEMNYRVSIYGKTPAFRKIL